VAVTFRFGVGALGETTARVYRAREPKEIALILGHGAGAPQAHPFMVDMATRLSARGIDVVTFDFLYMTTGKKLPDRTETLEATWLAVIAAVRARGGLPTERLFIGGKSMGGRIASHVAARAASEGFALSGLILLGYPLHPIGKPKVKRDEHLPRIAVPTLFVQGTRDELGTAKEIAAVVKKMQDARIHVVEEGDHSLVVPRRLGEGAQESALTKAADAIADFTQKKTKKKR